MHQTINEPIDVLVNFKNKKTIPLVFKWKNEKRKIETVCMTYTAKTGRGDCCYYSVTAGGDYFKLCFDAGKRLWFLKEVYYN